MFKMLFDPMSKIRLTLMCGLLLASVACLHGCSGADPKLCKGEKPSTTLEKQKLPEPQPIQFSDGNRMIHTEWVNGEPVGIVLSYRPAKPEDMKFHVQKVVGGNQNPDPLEKSDFMIETLLVSFRGKTWKHNFAGKLAMLDAYLFPFSVKGKNNYPRIACALDAKSNRYAVALGGGDASGGWNIALIYEGDKLLGVINGFEYAAEIGVSKFAVEALSRSTKPGALKVLQ
jgi:hypothetical protein